MADKFSLYKVVDNVPTVLEPNTLYCVLNTLEGTYTMYFSDSTGDKAYPLCTSCTTNIVGNNNVFEGLSGLDWVTKYYVPGMVGNMSFLIKYVEDLF